MEWILMIWVSGCAGLHCDPVVASLMEQPTKEVCLTNLETWKSIGKKREGVCLQGDIEHLNVIIEQAEDELKKQALSW